MDTALRGALRRTIVVVLVIATLGAGWVLHAVTSSSHDAAASHSTKKFSAGELIRLAASAGAGIYLQYDGITGPPGAHYRDDAPIAAFSWGVSRQTATTSGTRVGLAPNVNDVNITHVMDRFSGKLLQQSIDGQGANAVLYFTGVNHDSGLPVKYLEMDLTHVIITSYSTGASGTTAPTEELSLNFTSATFIVHFAGTDTQTITVNNI